MVEIPDSLRSVFSATVREHDEAYVIEIPSNEIDHTTLSAGETYRIAIFESPTSTEPTKQDATHPDRTQRDSHRRPPEPPVDEEDVREVTIETVGDQGDGIAKVERGYVVIVPDAHPGEEVTVKIDEGRENVAFASVVDSGSQAR